MQLSNNYGLKLMEGTDNVKRQDFVDNFTKIDTEIKNVNNKSDSVGIPYVTATGTANTYAVTLSPAPTAYTDGMRVTVKINVACTGASTLNVNSLGAKAIKDSLGNAITSGGLKANTPYTFCYEITSGSFILLGKGGGGDATAAQLLLGKKATVDSGQIVGTLDLTNLVTGNIKSGVTINGISGKSSVVDTADAVVAASQMITGTSGYVNGSKITGTMPYVTGDAYAHYPASQLSAGAYSGDGINYAYLSVPNGNYLNNVAWVKIAQPDLYASNIISGKNIFGIAGSATIPSMGGKQFASGTVPAGGSPTVNLPFTPSAVWATYSASGTTYYSTMMYGVEILRYSSSGLQYSSGITILTNSFKYNDYGRGFSWKAYE